jgi:hypothetical protein
MDDAHAISRERCNIAIVQLGAVRKPCSWPKPPTLCKEIDWLGVEFVTAKRSLLFGGVEVHMEPASRVIRDIRHLLEQLRLCIGYGGWT